MCEQLAKGRYLTAAQRGFELATAEPNTRTITPAGCRLVFTLLVPAHPGSPGQRAIQWLLLMRYMDI